MGQTTDIVFPDEVAGLIHAVPELHLLSQPFSQQEIDKIVVKLPVDKALGPDGFNGMFLKKCWPLIKMDFYKLCFDFHAGLINLEGLNECLITLVPKVHSPVSPNDYRPIFLLNTGLKFITKILANGLQGRNLDIVHTN